MPPHDSLPRLTSLAALGMVGGMLRTAAVLAALALAIAFALHRRRPNEQSVAVLRQAAMRIDEAQDARTAATTVIERARVQAGAAEREAHRAVSRSAASRARVRVQDIDEVTVSATPSAIPTRVRVPAPAVERMQLDSVAVVALGALVQWKDTVIVAQDRRITADSLELVARSNAFDALQRAKEPRCGRRCGIVLGVAGMLAAAVAVGQVRRMFR